MENFDVIIIGSGQAGTPLVFKMAAAGKKVAFIEKEHFGGTCVNDGCTPTKAYVASARRMWDAVNGKGLGVIIPEGSSVDLKKVKERKDAIVRKSTDGISKASGLEISLSFIRYIFLIASVFPGSAASPHTVSVEIRATPPFLRTSAVL